MADHRSLGEGGQPDLQWLQPDRKYRAGLDRFNISACDAGVSTPLRGSARPPRGVWFEPSLQRMFPGDRVRVAPRDTRRRRLRCCYIKAQGSSHKTQVTTDGLAFLFVTCDLMRSGLVARTDCRSVRLQPDRADTAAAVGEGSPPSACDAGVSTPLRGSARPPRGVWFEPSLQRLFPGDRVRVAPRDTRRRRLRCCYIKAQGSSHKTQVTTDGLAFSICDLRFDAQWLGGSH